MAAESFGVSIGSKIAELLVEPAINQFRYFFCFSNFVEDLEKQENNLSLVQGRVQNDVDAAIRNAEEIEKDVEAWLLDAVKAMEDVKRLELEIEQGRRSFIRWCPNWLWRFRLSRRMAKKTTNLVQLQEKGKFQRVSYHAQLPDIEFLSKDFMPSESSRLALTHIMEALNDDNVSMIGLHGMAGVGKTTLMKEVGKQVNQLKLFDKVLMLVVSQAQDFTQIQDQLGDKLYLFFQEKTREGKANRIWQRLKKEKKILIILDDVWKYLDLKDIGIPLGDDHKGCKILLTTRLQHVCTSMDCQREIQLNVLTEDEAWALFEKNAGVCDEQSNLTIVAKEVAKECKGLPIAIVTVGRALKGKNLDGWEVASRKLKASRLADIRDINKDDNAYTCLKLSFDYLQHEETKLCFFMCSLFPEDYEISIEDLVGYAVGLGWYKDAQSIEEARSEVFESIHDLKASCLLLETEKEEHVKMHDMVRDFALWIGSKMENGFKVRACIGLEGKLTENLEKYTAVSVMNEDITKFNNELSSANFPNLKMFLLRRKHTRFSMEEEYSSDAEEGSTDTNEGSPSAISTCFNGMQDLKVLSVSHEVISMQSLELLTKLQTLELKRCRITCSTSLTALQKLKSLEILNLHGSSIKKLPVETGELSNLRLLDLTCCEQLEEIPPNTIQSLSKLEELYIGVSSFRKWEVEGTSSQTSNASLVELNSLSHLAVLWLYIVDENIPKDFALPNLDRYRLQINNGVIDEKYPSRHGNPTSRSIDLYPSSVSLMNVCKELFPSVYHLNLDGNARCFKNIVPDIDWRGFNKLLELSFFLCDMKCLISMKQQQQQQQQQQHMPPTAFSNLQRIHIGKTSMTELCDGQPPKNFLEKLEDFAMSVSYGMTIIFPTKLWPALQSLKNVVVHGCDSVQAICQLDGLEGESKGLLSRLMTLRLEYVPELRYIWKGPTCHVNLKSLTLLKLDGCSMLTTIFSPWLAQSLGQLETLDISGCQQLEHIIAEKEDEGLESFSGSPVQSPGLHKLKNLKIYGCDKLEYVFPLSIAKDLHHLEDVNVASVAELKQFFGKGENGASSGDENDNLLLRAEKYSSMYSYFGSDNFPAVLPYLQHVELKGCPKLSMSSVIKILVPPKESTSSTTETEGLQIKTLTITGCAELVNIIVKDDDMDHVSLLNHFQSVCFSNLVHIRVYRCNKLKKLFPITISQGLLHLKYFEVIEACQLGEVFEGNDEAGDKQREIVIPKLVSLVLKELPSLSSFCPGGYHFVFPCLVTLTVEGCHQIRTRFTVASNGPVHAKPEKPQVVEQDIAIGSSSTQTTESLRTANEGINWNRDGQYHALPSYVEHENKEKQILAVENSSNFSRPTSPTKCMNFVIRRK